MAAMCLPASKCQSVWVNVKRSQAQIWHGALLHKTRESQHTKQTLKNNKKVLYNQVTDSKKKTEFRGKTAETILWQRGELTFNLTDLNVHVHFVT